MKVRLLNADCCLSFSTKKKKSDHVFNHNGF